ncbi:MAG: adenosylmethionine--8-amino-7-oxononanoate transaminase [Gammaproteobacteria bacterium]|nr:adenosylmethionine--8-amino-7-oxononanoate transaminase [Gammaproteobacteria bacterium]
MTKLFSNLAQRDLASVWHPCTQMKDHESLPMLLVKKAKGAWLEDFDGNRYLDGISSWWVNIFGHCNEKINQAIAQQLGQLEHVLLAGCSHEPVIDLSEQLIKITPGPLSRCFYADNGSSAIEAAIKMSFHYWRNQGQLQKTRFVNLANSYHGETIGALSMGDVALFREVYQPLLLDPITVPSPDGYHREPGETALEYARRMFLHMEEVLRNHHEEVCAVIVEPLVQCAGGMRMYDPEYLRLLRAACDAYGVHLIADEIAVGFGRTGTLFACEQADIAPDFMCLSKALTGGYLPMSAVLTTDPVYEAFYDEYENLNAFMHSHSYTGNPLGCAAALATLDIFKEENVIAANKVLSREFATQCKRFEDHPNVSDVRQCGMIMAIELVQDKATREPFPWQQRRSLQIYRYGLEHGVLLRPMSNVVYFMPPYVITTEEIRMLVDVAERGIELAVRDQ